ncbi:MAG: winged helix-turn-helix domain-containing protein, partial [Bacteroidota bacterium]
IRKALHGLLQPIPSFIMETSPKENELSVRFMGRFGLLFDNKLVGEDGLSPRNKSLLAYLLHNGHKLKHKNQIAETFWPYGSGSALNSLHVALHAIRKYIRAELGVGNLIEHLNGCYRINRQYTLQSDLAAFDSAYKNTDQNDPLGLITAYRAYSAPLLEDLFDEPWTGPIRTQYHHCFQHLVDQLIVLADANDLPIVSWELKAKLDPPQSRSAA